MKEKKIDTLKPIDILIISYISIISIIILIFNKNLSHWYIYIGLHIGIILFILFLNLHQFRDNNVIDFIHNWYIIPGFIFLYNEIGKLCTIVFPYYFDNIIIQLEEIIFKMQPSIELARILDSFVLSEIFHFGYISYFIMIPLLPAALYAGGNKDKFKRVVFGITFTFLSCYLIFIFFPVMGPRFAFADKLTGEMKSFFFRDIILFIFERGAVKGAAFPSSHVAVAVVILLFAFKYQKKLYNTFFPLVIFLIIGTVYGRFHYAIDSITGAVLGVFLFHFSRILYNFLKKYEED